MSGPSGQDKEQAPAQPPAAAGARARSTVALRRLHLLVVDDNKVNQMLLSAMLSRLGHDVKLAASGHEAVSMVAAQQPPFDMVLMDYQMPGMNGVEAADQIRALPGCGALPIVGVTADDRDPSRIDGLDRAMNKVVAKPVRREVLLQAIDACLPEPVHQVRAEAEKLMPEAAHPCCCSGREPEVRAFLDRLDKAGS